jgi:putative oxidoreductase
MGLIHQIEGWSETHHPKWLTVLRVMLGLALFVKGLSFIQNSLALEQLFSNSAVAQNFSWLSTVIPWLHLLGGALIIAGLFTRIAVLVQIPILLGAVFFVNMKHGFFSGGSDLPFSIIVLLLLCFFLVEGGGRLSLDNFLRKGGDR